MTHQN